MLGNDLYFTWEITGMAWLQAHLGSFGEKLATLFTMAADPTLLILTVLILYWTVDKDHGKALLLRLSALILWASMIKNVVLRRRPYFDHPEVQCLHPADEGPIDDLRAQGFSFPSIHAGNATVFYGFFHSLLQNKIIRALFAALPILIGLSRVALGVHYPTDVLCGWVMGLLILALFPVLERKIQNTEKLHLLILLSGLPGLFFCQSTDYFTIYGILLGSFFAFLYESRKVNFTPTHSIPVGIVRAAFGAVLYLVLNTLLKKPFSAEFLDSASTAAFLVRMGRYMIVSFIMIGLYPRLFRLLPEQEAQG